MRALEISCPNVVNELTVPVPEIDDDEALVRVAYSGICATDYEILGGKMTLVREGKIRYPVRIGHEWSGTVVKVGKNVSKVKVGSRVVSDPGVTCGKCQACDEGRYADCKDIKSVGTVNCWDGSFADYMRIPERHLYLLPDSITLQEAAVIEPAGIAYEAIKKIDNLKGKTVLIIGTGAIGMASVVFARYCGAEKVLLAGRTDAKLEIGKRMGADVVINIRSQNLIQEIMKLTDAEGVDFTVETSGNIDTVSQCLDLTKKHGCISYVGFYDFTAKEFPIDTVVSKELNVYGVMGHFGTAKEVIKAVEKGVDLKNMITHVIPFSEAKKAFSNPETIEGTRIKVLVDMS